MDAWTKALQPVSAPDFIDKAFKESPEGVSFRQWQPLDDMLDSMGRQLQGEDVLNHGGSSQGSQTVVDSSHRRMLSGGDLQTFGLRMVRLCHKLNLACMHHKCKEAYLLCNARRTW